MIEVGVNILVILVSIKEIKFYIKYVWYKKNLIK